MALHSGHLVVLDSTVVGEVQGLKHNQNNRTNRSTGTLATAKYASLVEQKPVLGFTSYELARVLGKGDSGRPWAKVDSWGAGYKQYLASRLAGGLYTSGGAHRSLSVAKGLMVVRRIMAEHLGDAEIDVDLLALSADGVAAAVVKADNATLPTRPTAERFTLGAWEVAGVALAGITRVTIDTGITIDHRSTDSLPLPTFAGVQQYTPTITIEGLTQAWWSGSGLGDFAAAGTQANTVGFFRKRDRGGVFVADETAEHVSVAAECLVHVQGGDASGTDDAPITIVLEVLDDGTNELLTFDTTAAIS